MTLLGYFLFTFVLAWAAWFAAAALAAPGNTGFFGVRGPVFLLGVSAPAIVALALTARAEGRAGVGRLLARIGRWRVGAPRLAGHLGLGGASTLLGGVWALWHLPLFFLPGTGSTGQSFPVYLLQVTALSVAMAWLYWKTEGSLLLVMLMHASVNNTTGIVPAAVAGASTPLTFRGSLVAWATIGLSWAIATPLLARMRGADIRGMLDDSLSHSGSTSSTPSLLRHTRNP